MRGGALGGTGNTRSEKVGPEISEATLYLLGAEMTGGKEKAVSSTV